ncbi:MAG: Gfo/Idh/MocA family oxidoreductase [Pseudomonadota bacterium]
MALFKFAVVGAGMAAKPHGSALVDLSDKVAVAGVYTRSKETREAFCTAHGLPPAPDYDALVSDPSIDGLLLLTPPDSRLDIIRRFAEAGKHVLCEKPLGRTLSEAQDATQICAEAGVSLGLVFQHRYRAASLALKEKVGSGALGRIELVRADIPWWRPQSYYDEPGRGSYARDGGGVLISQAIHTLDLMLWIAGPVTDVVALATTTGLHQMESEDFVTGGLRFASGAAGALLATTAAYPGDAEKLQLDCEHAVATLKSGTLTLNWRDGRTETIGEAAATGGGADPMAFPHDWHRDLIDSFVSAVQAGRAPSPNGDDAVAVQRLIDALLRAGREGRRIDVTNA